MYEFHVFSFFKVRYYLLKFVCFLNSVSMSPNTADISLNNKLEKLLSVVNVKIVKIPSYFLYSF